MKGFLKKIALVMTLALIIGLLPAKTAEAAALPGLSYASKIIYLDGDVTGKYTDSCKVPVKNTSGYKVSYSVKSGKELVTVASNGKVVATGVGVGKAVITASFKNNKSGAVTSANFTVAIKRNATDVKLTSATVKNLLSNALTIGDTLKLQTAKTATDYKAGNYGNDNYTKVITDLVRITSSDSRVITVDGFKLDAVGAGTATLKVETYQKEGNAVTAVKEYRVVVQEDEIANPINISNVSQLDTNKMKLTFDTVAKDAVKSTDLTIKNGSGADQHIKTMTWDTEGKVATIELSSDFVNDTTYSVTYNNKTLSFKAVIQSGLTGVSQSANNKATVTFGFVAKDKVSSANLTIKNSYGVSMLIKNITWDATGKIATVEFYYSFTNATVYTVAYDGKSLNFTANIGKPAKIAITGTKAGNALIPDNEPAEIIYKIYDTNGVDITELCNSSNVSFSTTSNYAWIDTNKITIFERGQIASVKAAYVTGEYNMVTGEAIILYSEPFAFQCVEKTGPSLTTNLIYTISKSLTPQGADWTKLVNSVAIGDESSYLYAKAKDTLNNDVYITSYESTDPSKLMVDPNTGRLYPIASGTVSVICKYGTYSNVVTVNVTAERKPTTISINPTPAVANLSSGAGVTDSATFKISVLDQYGNVLPPQFVTATQMGGTSVIVTPDESIAGQVTFRPITGASGTVSYKLETQGKATVVTITVKSPGNTYSSTRISLDSNKIDLNLLQSSNLPTVTISAAEYDNQGTKMSNAYGVSYTISTNGKVIYKTGSQTSPFVTDNVDSLVVSGVAMNSSTGNYEKMPAGTYKVEGTYIRNGSTVAIAATAFTVTDNSPTPIAKLKKPTAEAYIGGVKTELNTCFTVMLGNTELTYIVSDYVIAGNENIAGTYSVRIKEITAYQEINTVNGKISIGYKFDPNIVMPIKIR